MKKKSQVIGVIPARYASQRLPAKPLLDILGKPLIQRVYEQAQKSKLLDRVVVATDDAQIEKAVHQFGGEVFMTSSDIKSGSDRVAVVAAQVTGDIFVNIQGDEPFIAPEMINQGIRLLLDDSTVSVATLVRKIDSTSDLVNPNIVKVVFEKNGYALYFSRSVIPYLRDEMDHARWIQRYGFYKHIGLYIFRKKFLTQYSKLPSTDLEKAEKLEQLRILESGYRIKIGITTYDSIPVDVPEDLLRVRNLLQTKNEEVYEKHNGKK